ncbi:hypothetical protein MCHI_002788 [Candidatus Magnetoovum chiemensis]|nr:hypothetical protein MCHI_002788 [Candidatus Magnetoovum chiemensis]
MRERLSIKVQHADVLIVAFVFVWRINAQEEYVKPAAVFQTVNASDNDWVLVSEIVVPEAHEDLIANFKSGACAVKRAVLADRHIRLAVVKNRNVCKFSRLRLLAAVQNRNKHGCRV